MFETVKYGGLLGKAAGIYAKRITPEEFAEIRQKQTVEDIIGILKNHKGHGEVIASLSGEGLDREKLEHELLILLERDLCSLYRYADRKDMALLGSFIMKNDINQILSYIRLIMSGMTHTYAYVPSEMISNKSHLDFSKFQSAKSFDEFAELLSQTEYYKTLAPHKGEAIPNYTQIETELYVLLYKKTFKSIKEHPSRAVRNTLSEFYKTFVDLKNISTVLRCIRVGQDRQSIYAYLLPFSSDSESKQLINSAVNCGSYEEALSLISGSRFGEYFSPNESRFIEGRSLEYVYRFSKSILTKKSPNVTLIFAYLLYKELEIKNLVHIIEAKSYRLSDEETDRFLVGIEKAG